MNAEAHTKNDLPEGIVSQNFSSLGNVQLIFFPLEESNAYAQRTHPRFPS